MGSIYRWVDAKGFPAHRMGWLQRFRLSGGTTVGYENASGAALQTHTAITMKESKAGKRPKYELLKPGDPSCAAIAMQEAIAGNLGFGEFLVLRDEN